MKRYGGRYGIAIVPLAKIDKRGSVYLGAIDLLAQGMDPRPFFSERRLMERMRPTRLAVYLILRTAYFGLPDRLARTRLIRSMWGALQ